MASRDELMVFSGSSNRALAERICAQIGIPLSKLEVSRFSNDNLFVRVMENVRERDVFVVQTFSPPVSQHILELFIALDALRSASAKRVTAVIPYYSYSRSDKKDAPRISIAARLFADLMVAAGANRVLTMDLHSEQVHGFFSVPVDHLTAQDIIAEHLKAHRDLKNLVIVASDAGAAKRAGKFAQRLGAPLAIIDKRRMSDSEVAQGLIVGEVAGRDAVVLDDEISTGGTLSATVRTLQKAGVRSVTAAATHGVLCGDAIRRLGELDLASLILTDTVHIGEEKRGLNMEVLSVAPLMAEAIKRIHSGESVGELFQGG
jgi:ribose-phosphate pyrophosphokinase